MGGRMPNSIWKTQEKKPKSFSFILEHHKAYDFDNHKVITAYNIFETGGSPQNPFDENTIRWCYLDELLAQADKAERLQKALCFIRNIRGAGMSYQDMFLDAHEMAKTALDPEYKPVLCGRYDEEMLGEIQQLIKD